MIFLTVVALLEMSMGAFRQYVARKKVRKLATIDGVAFYAADDIRALHSHDETTEGVA